MGQKVERLSFAIGQFGDAADILRHAIVYLRHHSGHRVLISKPRVFGFGLNFQHCAHVVTFATHSWEQYYQSVRRCWRFGQLREVVVDVVSTEGESRVRENMARKSTAAEAMFGKLVQHMNEALTATRVREDQPVRMPSWLTNGVP